MSGKIKKMTNQIYQCQIDKGNGNILLVEAKIIEPYEGRVAISILDNREWTEESILYDVVRRKVIRNKTRERK